MRALPLYAVGAVWALATAVVPIPFDRAVRERPASVASDTGPLRARIRDHLAALTAPPMEGRGAGYPGDHRAAAYIAAQFTAAGLTPAGDDASFLQSFTLHPRGPTTPFDTLRSQNVVALLPGADPTRRDEVVVIGAHYDGQGMAGQANMGRRPPAVGDSARSAIWTSANDNAAAVAALLAIAERLAASPERPARSVLFVAFGAEEHGLVGSLHYTAHPARPWPRHVAMINLEMIGWEEALPMNVRATGTSRDWPALLDRATTETGVPTTRLTPALTNDTDHYGFGVRGLPVVHYGVPGSREHYHAVSDTEDRIAYDALARRAWHAATLLRLVADAASRPASDWRHPPDLGLTFTALTRDEYRVVGLPDSAGAIKLNAVAAGLPAAAAGLRAGDVVTAVNGRGWPRTTPGGRVLAEALAAGAADVRLTVWRRAGRETLIVTLRAAP